MRILVTGASGQLGSELVDLVEQRAASRVRDRIELVAVDHEKLDVADRDGVVGLICASAPDLVIHGAAWTSVDACEGDPDRAFQVNALGTRHIAEGARRTGAHVVYLSTDYVFDGKSERPYVEWDAPNPLSVYGRSKLGGEWAIDPAWTIVRTSWVVGRTGSNIVKTVLRLAGEGAGELAFVDDQRGSPTVAGDLAAKVLELGLAGRPGLFHVTNQGETTWFGLAKAVLTAAGLDPARVKPVTTAELVPPRPAPRPANSVLDNAALRLGGDDLLPPWEESLARLVGELA
jgi:dTDP-4-dehydrorhamnose reductase